MNVQPEVPNSVPALPQRRPLKLALAGIVLAGLVLLVIVLFFRMAHPKSKLTWLTPAELARVTRIGTFTRLKYKVMNLTAPLWQRWIKPIRINIHSTLFKILDEAAQQLVLPLPEGTNANGLRAWILSPAELIALQQCIKSNPGISSVSKSSLLTSAGIQSKVSVGNPLTPGTNSAFVGLTVDMVPKIAAGSISLMVATLSTEAVNSAGNQQTVLRTNFTATCRAFLPSAGGLLMEGGTAEKDNGPRYWFLTAPTAVDARGNAISLQR
jgi:hypothetical protein